HSASKTKSSLANPAKSYPPPPPPAEDELLAFDVHAALFPSGSIGHLPHPEAIKALQHNAEAVIQRLLAAYAARTHALHAALAETAHQEVEIEETEMRLNDMRAQLDGMAERVLQQDGQIRALAEELDLERTKRAKTEAAASAAFAAAGRANQLQLQLQGNGGPHAGAREREQEGQEGDDASDELVMAPTPTKNTLRDKRASSSTMLTTDSGFESGDETSCQTAAAAAAASKAGPDPGPGTVISSSNSSVVDCQSIFSRTNETVASSAASTSIIHAKNLDFGR
ncbi:hypothetical protein KEM52_004535, partial [Ascosphaera acerosa]